MKKLLLILTAVVVISSIGSMAFGAVIYNYTVTPNDLVPQANVTPATKFAWDWDQAAPIGSTTQGGAPGYGDSSFWSDVQGSAGPRKYTAIRLFANNIFGGGAIRLNELSEVSYFTKNIDGQPGDVDWQLKIYTNALPGDNPLVKWYGHRFNFDRPTYANTNWNESSTDSNLLVDWIYRPTGWGNGVSSYPANTKLTDLTAYGSETIMYMDIIAGYATNGPSANSYLDGIQMARTNGDTVNINLQAVPDASSSMLLFGICLSGLFGIRKKFWVN